MLFRSRPTRTLTHTHTHSHLDTHTLTLTQLQMSLPSGLAVPVSDGAEAHGSAMSHPGWSKGQRSSPTTRLPRLLAAARVIGLFRAPERQAAHLGKSDVLSSYSNQACVCVENTHAHTHTHATFTH